MSLVEEVDEKQKKKKQTKNNISTNNRSVQIKIKPIFKCIQCISSSG